jgi:hypothetical protein
MFRLGLLLLLQAIVAPPPPPVFRNVTVVASATVTAGGYRYAYTVTNPQSNTLDYKVHLAMEDAYPPTAVEGPSPCESTLLARHREASWIHCGDAATPGHTLTGLALVSPRPPTVVDAVVEGWIWDYVNSQPGGGDAVTEEDAQEWQSQATLRIPTLGPTPVEVGTFAHWDRWAADLARAGQFGWFSDAALLASVQANVVAARQALVAHNATASLAALQAVIGAMQASTSAQRTSEGLALALLNAQALAPIVAAKQPPLVEGVLTVTPASATHTVGESHTVTGAFINRVNGAPLARWPASVRVTKGPHTSAVHCVVCDDHGSFSYTFQGVREGDDEITVNAGPKRAGTLAPMAEGTGAPMNAAPVAPTAVETACMFNIAATAVVGVHWEGGPDLAVRTFSPPLLKSAPGNEFFVREQTTNLGTLPAPPSVTRYYLTDQALVDPATARVFGERVVPELAPRAGSLVERVVFHVPTDLAPGNYHLAACADADHAIVEINEDNNCSSVNVLAHLGIAMMEYHNQPPDCSRAKAEPDVLWPANHRLVEIAITGVTDPDGDPVTITVTGNTQDEPTNGVGDGDTAPDGFGVGTSKAQVRAERSGTGNGRVYAISFKAEDGKGGACTGVVKVSVPHDRGKGSVAVDDGQSFDSTR